MITPNKVLSLDESILSRLAAVLRKRDAPIDLVSLYHSVSDEFVTIDDFIVTLDVLFILDKIDINFRTRTVKYAGRN